MWPHMFVFLKDHLKGDTGVLREVSSEIVIKSQKRVDDGSDSELYCWRQGE